VAGAEPDVTVEAHRRDGSRPGVVAQIVACTVAFIAWSPADPSGETILKNVEAQLSGVNDYTVMLDISVDVERLNIPPMHVRMYFKRPDKVHFDSEGFAMLPREGLAFSASGLLSRYTVAQAGRETLGGSPLFKVTLSAKSDRMRARTMHVYVHPGRWTTEKLVIPQAGERLMSITFRYEKVDAFWLPSELVASFEAAPVDSTEASLQDLGPAQRPRTMPRTGTVTVRYSKYALNTGLSDKIFQEDSKPSSE
jgi:hypothetical protein